MLPAGILEKLDTYGIYIGEFKVSATVVEQENQLPRAIEELRASLGTLKFVGFDLKTVTVPQSSTGTTLDHDTLLVLFTNKCCLLILLGRLRHLTIPLTSFLCDTSICFLCNESEKKINLFRQCFPTVNNVLATVTEIRPLVGKILRDPVLRNPCSLVDLGKKLGFYLKEERNQINRSPDWADLWLSEEDIKMEIHEAYMCYTIAVCAMKKRDALSGTYSVEGY